MATRIVFESSSDVTEVMELLESFILTLHRVGVDQYEVVDETGEPIHFSSVLLEDMEGVKEIFEDGDIPQEVANAA